MGNYKELEIYEMAFDLAIKVHKLSLELPSFEKFEQGNQIRRSSKSIKDQIAEGYGRKRYKADFIKFLTYSQASCDECSSQIEMITQLYPENKKWAELIEEYRHLGKKINRFIQYVEQNWKT